jgi:hypothetical protein
LPSICSKRIAQANIPDKRPHFPSRADFAMVFGGGIDVKLGKRIDLRLIQVDYNPIFVKTRNGIEGKTQHNFRIGVGLVFH